MINKIIIRRATIDDMDDILRLTVELFDNERENFGSDWSADWINGKGKEIISAGITDTDNFIAVAASGGRVVAFLRGGLYRDGWMAWKNGKGAELWDIFIEKEFRRRRLGRKMAEMFLAWCRDRAADYVLVNVTAANRAAAGFYEELGFGASQKIMEKKIK